MDALNVPSAWARAEPTTTRLGVSNTILTLLPPWNPAPDSFTCWPASTLPGAERAGVATMAASGGCAVTGVVTVVGGAVVGGAVVGGAVVGGAVVEVEVVGLPVACTLCFLAGAVVTVVTVVAVVVDVVDVRAVVDVVDVVDEVEVELGATVVVVGRILVLGVDVTVVLGRVDAGAVDGVVVDAVTVGTVDVVEAENEVAVVLVVELGAVVHDGGGTEGVVVPVGTVVVGTVVVGETGSVVSAGAVVEVVDDGVDDGTDEGTVVVVDCGGAVVVVTAGTVVVVVVAAAGTVVGSAAAGPAAGPAPRDNPPTRARLPSAALR